MRAKVGKSIYGRVKSINNFEPQVCPILIHGEAGAEGTDISSFKMDSSAHAIWQDNQFTEQKDLAYIEFCEAHSCNNILHWHLNFRQPTGYFLCRLTKSTSLKLFSRCIMQHHVECGFIAVTLMRRNPWKRNPQKKTSSLMWKIMKYIWTHKLYQRLQTKNMLGNTVQVFLGSDLWSKGHLQSRFPISIMKEMRLSQSFTISKLVSFFTNSTISMEDWCLTGVCQKAI